MMSAETKKRIIDIIITALVGALIAFLQGLLTGLVGMDVPAANPKVAGGAAALFKGIKTIKTFIA